MASTNAKLFFYPLIFDFTLAVFVLWNRYTHQLGAWKLRTVMSSWQIVTLDKMTSLGLSGCRVLEHWPFTCLELHLFGIPFPSSHPMVPSVYNGDTFFLKATNRSLFWRQAPHVCLWLGIWEHCHTVSLRKCPLLLSLYGVCCPRLRLFYYSFSICFSCSLLGVCVCFLQFKK